VAQIGMSKQRENTVKYGMSVVCRTQKTTQSENRGSTPLGGILSPVLPGFFCFLTGCNPLYSRHLRCFT